MKKNLVVLIFCIILSPASALSKKINGHYTTFTSDEKISVTLIVPFSMGEPKYGSMMDSIYYLSGDMKKSLLPKEVKEIVFEWNNEIFKMHGVYDNVGKLAPVFLHLTFIGSVRLYDYVIRHTQYGSHYPGLGYMGGANPPYDEVRSVFQKDGQELFLVRTIGFKQKLGDYFSDCPALSEKIRTGKVSDLRTIASIYMGCKI